MQILKNSYDKEMLFETLEEAKKHIIVSSKEVLKDVKKNKNEILFDTEEEKDEYLKAFENYIKELENAETMLEFVEIWNTNTDKYENGSQMIIEEIKG